MFANYCYLYLLVGLCVALFFTVLRGYQRREKIAFSQFILTWILWFVPVLGYSTAAILRVFLWIGDVLYNLGVKLSYRKRLGILVEEHKKRLTFRIMEHKMTPHCQCSMCHIDNAIRN